MGGAYGFYLGLMASSTRSSSSMASSTRSSMASKTSKARSKARSKAGLKNRGDGRGKMVEIKQLQDLIDWFEANHDTKIRVEAKIYKKHTGHPVPSHNEQIRVAICYGWIDTTVKRIDEDSYMRIFVKRKPSAKWSLNTLRYAAELTDQGKMKPFGTEQYQRALQNNSVILPRPRPKQKQN